MSATHKSSGAAAAAGSQLGNAIDVCFAEYAKGLDGLAELRRKAVDVAAQQEGAIVNAWRLAIDSAVEGFQKSVQAQKDLLDLAVERGRAASRLAKEHADAVTKTVAGATAVLDNLAGVATAAQKQAVEQAAVQNTAAYDAAKRQFEASGHAATEAFQRGVEAVIDTQRTILKASAA